MRIPHLTVPLLALALTACAVGSEMSSTSGSSVIDDGKSDGVLEAPTGEVWVLPEDVRLAGERAMGTYVGAGLFEGGEACAGDLLPGTIALLLDLNSRHRDLAFVGYVCAPHPEDASQAWMYATGRALAFDVELETGPDRDLGDAIANELVRNAAELGVQLVVWNGTKWNVSYTGRKDAPYRGARNSTTRVYVELTPEGAMGAGAAMGDPTSDDGASDGSGDGPSDPATPPPPPEPPEPPAAVCTDTCIDARDDFCDDGGPGSETDWCPLGTDCWDCGPR